MEFLASGPIVFANATIVAADRVLKGHVAVEAGRIAYETGLAAQHETASATSPLTAFLDQPVS